MPITGENICYKYRPLIKSHLVSLLKWDVATANVLSQTRHQQSSHLFEIPAGGGCPAPNRLNWTNSFNGSSLHLSSLWSHIQGMLPVGVSDFCRRFWDDCIHTTCYFPTEKSKNEKMLKFWGFLPSILPVFSPPGQIIHINYCLPAVFLLTFQQLTLVEPVQRCERARSLPTLSSKQESDTASIRPRLAARRSIQPGENRSCRHATAPLL